MDDFGVLARDFGFRPQGKSAPMKPDGIRPPSSSLPFAGEENHIFSGVFIGPPKHTSSNAKSTSAMSDLDYDSIFKSSASMNSKEAQSKATSMNLPVYDKPVYDDEIFDAFPGLKSKSMSSSASARYEDNVFASMTKSPPKRSQQSDDFNDLLGNLGRKEKVEPPKHNLSKSPRDFDDLLPGFGSGNPAPSNRSSSQPTPKSTTNTTSNAVDDPFVVLESMSSPVNSSCGFSTDPQEETVNVSKSRRTKTGRPSLSRAVFDDINPLNGFSNPSPAFPSETNNMRKDQSPSKESTDKASLRYSESQSRADTFQESHQTIFDLPESARTYHRSFDQTASPASYTEKNSQTDDIWLTVSEIPLFTQPTRAPPPSRPPPPIPRHLSKHETGSLGSDSIKAANGSLSPSFAKFPSPRPKNIDENVNTQEMDSNLAAAAMKEAMDRAEAKFRHAKEVREREHAKSFRKQDADEELRRDRLERDREVEEREQRRLEREKARQAVERATREACERAAIEAHEKASVEARLKTERAAVQRAQAEARERAAVEAKERAERAEEDMRRRAERAAVERVAAEARKRAAAEAASRMNQQKKDNDLESFFGTGSRPSSAPRPRATSSDSQGPKGAQRTSTSGVSSNMRKASSTTNIVDDLSSIFGAAPTASKFHEVEGETEERRRARMERQQRTQERAAKALAEKNERDLHSQREQEERHRIGGTLDVEIKRWAAGKEGNLRALLSTLQYVLWPECGWQPVSLTDLITGTNVKKAYRKATLCIHPDKVQQKGANLQQKYVAEKVFDILKEAWNKFNSEELF